MIPRAQQFQPGGGKLFGGLGFQVAREAFKLVRPGRCGAPAQGLLPFVPCRALAQPLFLQPRDRVFLALKHRRQGDHDQGNAQPAQQQERPGRAKQVGDGCVQIVQHRRQSFRL